MKFSILLIDLARGVLGCIPSKSASVGSPSTRGIVRLGSAALLGMAMDITKTANSE
jgi:hypothetical protein